MAVACSLGQCAHGHWCPSSPSHFWRHLRRLHALALLIVLVVVLLASITWAGVTAFSRLCVAVYARPHHATCADAVGQFLAMPVGRIAAIYYS